MMTKNVRYWVRPAFVLGMWLLGSLSGYCFWNSAGRGDELSVANAADSKAVLRAAGPMAKANPLRFSTKHQGDKSDLVYYGYRYYNASTGRWLSRDPINEEGGLNLYQFVNNRPASATDALGLIIETTCPIDAYLLSHQVRFTRTGRYRYSFAGDSVISGDASPHMILTRMLLTKHVFKPANVTGSETVNLQRHVDARLTIVRNALKANFLFGIGKFPINNVSFYNDPQAYFNSINNGTVTIACQQLSRIIFETGNNFAKDNGGTWGEGRRPYDFVWIPGDWGYIKNIAYERGIWPPGLEGENVFHTGASSLGEMFWGHFQSGVHPSMSMWEWFEEVRSWTGGGMRGMPEWRSYIVYPVTGLRQ